MSTLPPGENPQQVFTPYASGMNEQLHPRTSGTAVASLVLGILLCVPIVTGVAAIIFAIAGFKATRNHNVRGRGLAIAGLTLGIASLIGWSILCGSVGIAWIQTRPDRIITTTFVQDLHAGNIPAAKARCVAGITNAQLQQAVTYLQGFGTLNSYSNQSFNLQWNPDGSTTAVISGTANFSSGTHAVTVTFIHPPHGNPTIQGYNIQ
jgi:hypothetical protein